ncbi:TadE/TadG family type IV pilus assembly protein [Limobrevibacterium gyesilva]|uniref:Pilus assembly protein n=1 Tax=Limobrevibacterium gyesilva TaxID=2991712 RepID=A0AA41YRU7_9PROT|nr:pilus assembly protein [Limobrevibacterium gyesilva]
MAALEFAIIVPVLLVMLAGLTDFALAFWSRGVLASSVAQGAQYAVLVGPTVSTSAIRSIVGQQLSLPAANVTITGPSCYCVSGTPAAASIQTCGNPCPNGTMPGTYITISASYTYTSLMPLYSNLTNPLLTETTMARLK